MKLQFWILSALLLLSCNPTSPDGSVASVADDLSVEELEKKGFEMFQESPEAAIQVFKQVAVSYERQGNLVKAGISNLNIANVYDEYLAATDSAIVYSGKALKIWEAQKDTLQMANLYKYIGLLKGRSGKLDAAKSDIQYAIGLYEKTGFRQGIAVSEINLAEVCFMDQNYTESKALFSKSKEFWKENGDLGRVFTDNILGIRVYHQIGDQDKVEELINENKGIRSETALDDFILGKFDELIDELEKEAGR